MKRLRYKSIIIALMAMCSICMTGCGKDGLFDGDTKIVLTTGFKDDEVFRIEKISCMKPEMMVYLSNVKNQYEETFGSELWERTHGEESIAGNVKENVLAQITKVKTMNLLAQEYEVTLTDSEVAQTNKAAAEYYGTLTEEEVTVLGVYEEMLATMYQEYALANKLYQHLIADINPEISDDEARTITVQHILVKTTSESNKSKAYERIQEAYERAVAGEEFALLMAEYSEDENTEYSFGKGTTEEEFETAAFNLATGEISKIVETSSGYHIIKCISTFDKEETDRNKLKIIEQRRKEVFNETYTEFTQGLTGNINQELWDSISFLENEEVHTSSFFEIYQKHCSSFIEQED
ncbi:MAG: peptidylprolyl isomerase [Lachnospiraceae bacterium]|nr:peptidylprolyl isomerase [Lachnospiraceae bacterium]